MTVNADIARAIEVFKDRSAGYAKTTRYYAGDHDLSFATEKFINAFGKLFHEFSLNVCKAICDAVRDKLIVTEFRVEEGGNESIAKAAWKIWQDNRMGKRSGEIHKEAVKNGDAYAVVWVDREGKVTIYPNKANTCMVEYDAETPGKILWAAKYWTTSDKKVRLNLFYPDRIEKFEAKKRQDRPAGTTAKQYDKNFTGKTTDHFVSLPAAKDFVPLDGEPIRNPYGVVPVFHFGNNADMGGCGQSELASAIPVQDALNKAVLDMLVAMEFASYRQRWASGIEIEYDDKGKAIPPYVAGIERLWVSENTDAKFGSFDATDIEQFLKVKDGFRVDMAVVTGTPLYYFMQTGGEFPSGEALKKAETRFVNKVKDRMESFGQVWEELMAFALTIEKQSASGIRLFTEWEDPSPMSETDQLNNLILKQDLGVSDEQLLIEACLLYTSPSPRDRTRSRMPSSA